MTLLWREIKSTRDFLLWVNHKMKILHKCLSSVIVECINIRHISDTPNNRSRIWKSKGNRHLMDLLCTNLPEFPDLSFHHVSINSLDCSEGSEALWFSTLFSDNNKQLVILYLNDFLKHKAFCCHWVFSKWAGAWLCRGMICR